MSNSSKSRNTVRLLLFGVISLCLLVYNVVLNSFVNSLPQQIEVAKRKFDDKNLQFRESLTIESNLRRAKFAVDRLQESVVDMLVSKNYRFLPLSNLLDERHSTLVSADRNEIQVFTISEQNHELAYFVARYVDRRKQDIVDSDELYIQWFPELVFIHEFVFRIQPKKWNKIGFAIRRTDEGELPVTLTVGGVESIAGKLPAMKSSSFSSGGLPSGRMVSYLGDCNPTHDGIWFEATPFKRIQLHSDDPNIKEFIDINVTCRRMNDATANLETTQIP